MFKDLVLIWRAKKIIGEVMDMDRSKVKSGLRTSEFWLALLGSLIPVLNGHLGLSIPSEGVMAVAGVIVSYVIGRSAVKRGA